MTILVDEEYGKAMIKRQAEVLPDLRARRRAFAFVMKTTTSARALCAVDMVIRRHENRQNTNE
ncbi:hypothetical protein K2P47_04180 [Patescibacteria group bacterium]|nr:hypothetical protein [Patescibacteria group bacterium]